MTESQDSENTMPDADFIQKKILSPDEVLSKQWDNAKCRVKKELKEMYDTAYRENTAVFDDGIVKTTRLDDDLGLHEAFAFTFRYNWEDLDGNNDQKDTPGDYELRESTPDGKPDYMLLFENPGKFGSKRHKEALAIVRELQNNNDTLNLSELIYVHRYIAKRWLLDEVRNFSDVFFPIVADKLDEPENVEGYIKGEDLFKDFYYSNVSKYRIDDQGDEVNKKSFEKVVQDEIERIGPDYIFIFGSSAWDAFREVMK